MPEDLRELYVEFAQAAEMAQVMEVEAGNLALAFVTTAFDTSKITEEQSEFFRALVDDVNRRTFGNLMREIRKTATVSEAIDTTINGVDSSTRSLPLPVLYSSSHGRTRYAAVCQPAVLHSAGPSCLARRLVSQLE